MLLTAFYARLKLLKRDALTLWYALKHAGTPLILKIFALLLVAYAFSPIDLIPDFIPILGMLDEMIIIPLGVWILLKLMPDPVVAECRLQVEEHFNKKKPKPRNYLGGVLIFGIWMMVIYWVTMSYAVPFFEERQSLNQSPAAAPAEIAPQKQ
jgi:uncharacterized membrane protein YkvA (DUF1232 family)